MARKEKDLFWLTKIAMDFERLGGKKRKVKFSQVLIETTHIKRKSET